MTTKNIFGALVLPLAALLVAGCEKIAIPKEELTGTYDQVYMAAAARNINTPVLRMMDTTYHITYGASFGGFGSPAQDIDVQFVDDGAKVAAYNQQNGTSYPALPASCYEMGDLNAIIPKGQLSTAPLAVKVNPDKGMELFKDYMLAVSIKSVSGDAKMNTSLSTAFFIIRASLNFSDFTDYNRAAWTIVGFSSQEPEEGPDNGGLALHTIDGKDATFWHTQWSGGNPPPPHWLTVDMGVKQVLHGLIMKGRQSTNPGKPNTVKVEVSDDNTTWTNAGTYTLQNVNAEQRFFLPTFPEGRYFKITVETSYGASYTHLAELGAF